MTRQSTDSENSGDYNWHRLWETPSKKFQRRYAKAWVHLLPGDLPISEAFAVLEHPIGPSLRNHGDLPTHFQHLVPINARRPLYPTTLTYRRMTSYLPTALLSYGVHHPRTPRKPNPEKAPLVDPTDPSVPRNAGYGEKLAGTDAS